MLYSKSMIPKQRFCLYSGFLLLLLIILLPFGACAVFNLRYKAWEQDISRDKSGVACFALPYTLQGNTTALLLIHGFGDSPQVWSSLAPELANKGYTVRAMRLPGWGEPPEVKRRLTLEQWVNAIQEEIDTLQTHHHSIVVLAHSMSGALTTCLAQAERLSIDALILYAPMFGVSNRRSPILSTRSWFEIADRILPPRMLIESLFSDHVRVNSPRPRTLRDPFVPKNMYRLLYAIMDGLQSQPSRIDFPVRLVLPGEDPVVRSDLARTWFESLKAPSKTLHIEKDAGHVIPLDLDCSREADRIHLWIQEAVR
jgi:carboxylesterase